MFVKSRDGTALSRVSTVTATVVVVLIRCFITVEAPAQGMVLGSAAQGFLPTSIQETQFTCIPWGEPEDFYTNQRTTNQWVIPIWLTPDINRDGYCDVFIAFATAEDASEPFVLRFFNPTTGRFDDASDRIRNNMGQPYARRSMAVDLNQDSWLDFIVVSHPEQEDRHLSFVDFVLSDGNGGWRQQRMMTGTRHYPPGSYRAGYWHGFAVGDIDLDGDPDVVIADWNAGSFILENTGYGVFVERPAFDYPLVPEDINSFHFTMELLDVNGDGFLDLLAWGGHAYSLFYGDGTMVFKAANHQPIPSAWWPPEYGVMDYHLVDLDTDGDEDLILVVTDYRTWRLAVLRNAGLDEKGWVTWDDVSEEFNAELIPEGLYDRQWPRFIAIMDINADGHPDVVSQTAFSFNEGWALLGGPDPMRFALRRAPIIAIPNKLSANLSGDNHVELTWDYSDEDGLPGRWMVYNARRPFGDRTAQGLAIQVTRDPFFSLESPEPGLHVFRVGWEDAHGVSSPLSESIEVRVPESENETSWIVPDTPFLGMPYPNPSAGGVTLVFRLVQSETVRLTLWDVMGKQVGTLIQGAWEQGLHETFLPLDAIPAGSYFIRMEAGSFTATEMIRVLH
ncbi:MAG: T9SS type A sorting domain-containing protein [Verrucomicrobia bacterium]|nr:T9SS type A sorting domain-containing protein [Verrucomicrobiota bacterium]